MRGASAVPALALLVVFALTTAATAQGDPEAPPNDAPPVEAEQSEAPSAGSPQDAEADAEAEAEATPPEAGPVDDPAAVNADRSRSDQSVDAIREQIARWDVTAEQLERQLEIGEINTNAVDRLRETLNRQRDDARALIERLNEILTPLRTQLETLGPAPTDGAEDRDLTARRAALEVRVQVFDGLLRATEQALTRARLIEERLAEAQRATSLDALLQRGVSLLDPEIWRGLGAAAGRFVDEVGAEIRRAVAAFDPFGAGVLRSLGVLIVLLLGVLAHVATSRRADAMRAVAKSLRTRLGRAFARFGFIALRVAPLACTAWGVAAIIDGSGVLRPAGSLFVWSVAHGATSIAAAWGVARLLYAPSSPQLRVIDLGDAGAAHAVGRITWFALFVALTLALLEPMSVGDVDPAVIDATMTALGLAAGPLLVVVAQTLFRRPAEAVDAERAPARPTGSPSPEEGEGDLDIGATVLFLLRAAATIVGLAIPILALLGYIALARFLLLQTAASLWLTALSVIAFVALSRLVATEPSPEADAGADAMTEAADAPRGPAGGGLTPIVLGAFVAMFVAPAFAFVWGVSVTDLQSTARQMWEGFEIGGELYSPVDIVLAFGAFFIGLWLTRFLQSVLRRSVLPNTRLDAGARMSLVAGVGYLGFVLTALWAVSTAGLDLSNLAIVLGALSVGIGFGLQNIVSNFVSGVILMIERPVKVGDWIVVGDSQGYVRKINVRSTEIETFDRASVIVPNSDLISNKVQNWTHKNLTGRAFLRLGVSYDADPEEVMALIKSLAQQHPMVLRYPEPFITFSGFGDSALEFEARIYIRDVNWVLGVESDIRLAILKELRARGIEIPFPQTDLHIRSGSPEDQALYREAVAGPQTAPPKSQPAATAEPAAARPEPSPQGSDTPPRGPKGGPKRRSR